MKLWIFLGFIFAGMWDEFGIIMEDKGVMVCFGTFIEINELSELESHAAI